MHVERQCAVADVSLYTPSNGAPREKVRSGQCSLVYAVGLVFLPGDGACQPVVGWLLASSCCLLPSFYVVLCSSTPPPLLAEGLVLRSHPAPGRAHRPLQARYAQEKVLRGSWGLPRLSNGGCRLSEVYLERFP